MADLEPRCAGVVRLTLPRLAVPHRSRHLIRLLVDARLDEDAAERDVHALYDGRALVLVRGGEAVKGLL